LISLLAVQERQISLVLQTHDREFDALMRMIKEMKPPPVPLPEPDLSEPIPLPKEKVR
jgi:hypothetical protein